jgi:hypothetical protein
LLAASKAGVERLEQEQDRLQREAAASSAVKR